MRFFIAFLSLLLLAPASAMAWGKKGHDVIAYIAQSRLSDTARERVRKVLGGRSMVYYANWMDSVSHTKEYDETREWHYFNIDKKGSVESAKRSKKGDLLTAVEGLEIALKDGKLTPKQEKDALRMLIHLVGDMHQPMHLGRESDEGGNKIPVVYFVESTSLHALWDYHIVEGVHLWSYTEWQREIDCSVVDDAEIMAGSYVDWMAATHAITQEIYRDTPAETRVFYEYMDKYTPIVENQLLYAGVRLGYIINDIY